MATNKQVDQRWMKSLKRIDIYKQNVNCEFHILNYLGNMLDITLQFILIYFYYQEAHSINHTNL